MALQCFHADVGILWHREESTISYMLRMPLPQLPPNPSLLAILLLVNTGGGPNLIFHYPPDPLTYKNTASTRHREVAHGSEQTESNSSPSSSEAAWSSDEELEEGLDDINETRSRTSRTSTNSRRLPTRNSARHGAFSSSRSAGSKGPELETDDYEGYSRQPYSDRANANLDGEDVEWTHLLGYSIKSLEALLSPRASFHKKKFEVCLDNTIFLSCPIFAKSGGGWRKRRRKRTSKKEGSKSSDTQSTPQNNERLEKYSTTSDEVVFEETDEEEDGEGEEVDEGRAEGRGVDGDGERLGREGKEQKEQGGGGRKEAGRAEQKIPSSIRGSRNLSDEGSETKSNSSVGADEDLSMFNVVFVLSPPSLEYRIRVTDIYQNVAKKFAKALKYEQKRSGYMSKQTRKILAWKDKGRDSSKQLVSS